MPLELLSIITICKNSLADLKLTSQSVHSQDCKIFKHIIIDGDSVDGTKEWMHNNSKLFYKAISEKDSGIYDAMNKGIQYACQANTKWTIFLNSGDVFESNNTLSSLRLLLENEDDAIFLFGSVRHNKIYKSGILQKVYHPKLNLKSEMPGCHQSCFIRTDFLRYNRFNMVYKIASDFDMWLYATIKLSAKSSATNIIVSEISPGGISQLHEGLLQDEYFDIISNHLSIIYALKWILLRKLKFVFRLLSF